jgi:hypothetical protein
MSPAKQTTPQHLPFSLFRQWSDRMPTMVNSTETVNNAGGFWGIETTVQCMQKRVVVRRFLGGGKWTICAESRYENYGSR